MINYGFACKTIGIPGADQTVLTLAKADEENLLRVSRHNLQALGIMLRFCAEENIPLMRLSSDIIPLASHPDIVFNWRSRLKNELAHIGETISRAHVRVSMHPGQYTILNSPRDEVVIRAIEDLRFHAEFLDAVGADNTARIVLHLGGGYGDKPLSLERLKDALQSLPQHVFGRLALENDERIYTIEEVLGICGQFDLPAIFDVFHHSLNPPPYGTMEYWLDASGQTWNTKTGRQKIHYSQQMPGAKAGTHSRNIGMKEFLVFHKMLGARELDVMLEVKDKNLSAIKCANLVASHVPRNKLTEEWARYKYLILEHDPVIYNEIRALLKTGKPKAEAFYACIEAALEKEITPGHARNAAQHVWGYVDSLASEGESKKILTDMKTLEDDIKVLARLKRKLFATAEKYHLEYLLRSLYFYF